MAKILVTGAAGFIGSHTAELLLAHGHEVAAADNFRTGREANLTAILNHPRFRLYRADIAGEGVLSSLLAEQRPDAVIHLAALVSVPESIAQPELNHRLNLEATRMLSEAAAASDTVRRIVFASSAAVYGNNPTLPLTENAVCQPLSPYGSAKLDSERLLLDLARIRGITVRCQRYFNVYGPRQDPASPYSGVISRFAQAIRMGLLPAIHGDGEQTRDFIYVGDVARANLLGAVTPAISSGVANICTGRPVSLNLLLQELGRAAGKQISATYGPSRAGDIRHSCGSPETARTQFGFGAEVSLGFGLERLLASLR